ncbi:MAG: hypothetical protein JST15_11520 [Bacteroidetes bacterium]|nr:hypothetical protein [Bacteroidota bacterium]
MENLFLSGLLIYSVNYITGWLLYSGKISIGKTAHQTLFISIILNLTLILIFVKLPFYEKIICALSLCMMISLPFGKKGGRYHIAASSAGLFLYILLLLIKLTTENY